MGCIEQKKSPAADSDGRDYNPYEVMEPRLPEKTPVDRRNGKPVKANDIPPQGVYLPNNNFLAPHMKSPEYVQLSNAAAITLGIMGGRMYGCDCTRCLNLLLTYPEGCRANCAYCGLARHREAERDYADRNFIRVDWPAVPMGDIVDIVASDPENSPFHRMCISMITHPRSEQDTFAVLEQWTDRIDPDAVPVSILSNPTTMTRDDVQKCKDLGADIFTVALDAATPELFDRTRGKGVQSPHKWKKYWDTLLEAKDIPRAGTGRSRRAQPHVLLFPRGWFADGPPPRDASRSVAPGAACPLPGRLPRRARRADEIRRAGSSHGLRHSGSRAQ
jgi:biotin synthase